MDRHEYEINQLINPKKDIVKSNSKHRDKIETLIQGRRIGKIDGGGDTPFSPTPWIFDTGAAPQSMGQNCVAGTTEFDEENGIGLVMYVESGSNIIIWKMSDGTKNEYTFPVSSDYQNMLRTAFQNKTGITIGYFIFHPYTEETIDIESSITINS